MVYKTIFVLAFVVSAVLTAGLHHDANGSGSECLDMKAEIQQLKLALEGLRNLMVEQLSAFKSELSETASKGGECCQKTLETCKQAASHVQINTGGSTRQSCESMGYTPFKTSCYKIFRENYKWRNAMSQCHQDGAHLVDIESKEEQDFIQGLIAHGKTNNGYVPKQLWIGGHDSVTEGNFVWESTGKNVTYTNWMQNEPNRRGNEDCIEISAANGQWNDEGCGARNGFICERTG